MAKFFKSSLFLRLSLLFLLGSSLVLFITLGINHISSKKILLQSRHQYYATLAKAAAQKINTIFVQAVADVNLAATKFSIQKRNYKNAQEILDKIINGNPSIMGSAIALAPDQDYDTAGYRILYGWKSNGKIKIIDRPQYQCDYQSDWFYLPYHLTTPIWTDPYFDEDSEVMMTTYSFPVIENQKVVAVITCDIALDYIQDFLSNLELGKQGIASLVTKFGKIIVHPNPKYIMRETLISLGQACSRKEDGKNLCKLSRIISQQTSGQLNMNALDSKQETIVFFNKVDSTDWHINLIIPETQIVAPLVNLNKKMVMITILGLILLLIPAFLVSLSVTKPLKSLCRAAEILSRGDFEAQLPKRKNRDEIWQLVQDFDLMRINLKSYMKNLAKTTAEKEKISNELSIAEEIQHSILPKLFPPFPEREGLDLFAILNSAKEVGGDLYDFALLDNDHLYICIGDVSGKGVPASLFMAVGKTLLKSTIQTIKDPAKALAHVNNELEEGNDACMFITVFCGILNLKTSQLVYANAGHNPPVIVAGDETRFLKLDASAPIAVMPDIEYLNQSITLNPNDRFLLYTDGVTEAQNLSRELYDEDRLINLLKEDLSDSSYECISNVVESVNNFAGPAPQADDITMLCIRYNHNLTKNTHLRSPSATLMLSNQKSDYNKLLNWLDELQLKLNWSQELLMQLNLVLEEWIVNVMSYAHNDDDVHHIELKLWHSSSEIKFEIIDDGVPFNPLKKDSPDLNIPLEDREIGGLGIHFIKETMDEFLYERKNDKNIVTIVKKL